MKSPTFGVLSGLACLTLVRAYTVDPPTTAPSDTIQDCTNWHVGAAGDTCDALASDNFIELADLYRYNPSLASGCKIVTGLSYCVEENFGLPPPVTTSSSGPTSTSIAIPTPTQNGGFAPGCYKFYFVTKQDDCKAVLANTGLTLDQLFFLNPGVNKDCTGLWQGVYVCTAAPGLTATSSTPPTTTATGLATPSPTQPGGYLSGCNKFYFVTDTDTCDTVLATNHLTLPQLSTLNPGVKSDCSGLWRGVYVCIASPNLVLSTSTSSTVTTATTGLATPSPTQPGGYASGCNKFYFVKDTDTCDTVLATNHLTLPQLNTLNPGVKSDCSGLWKGVYVCIASPSVVFPTSSTPTTPTTTSKGNGVATPTPTQPGMVTNCKTFYQVADGDNCSTISAKLKVSVADIKKWNTQVGSSCAIWLGYYICVAVL